MSADDGLADVVTLPTRRDGLRAGLGGAVGGLRAALDRVPAEVDDWGRDPACVALQVLPRATAGLPTAPPSRS